MIYNLDFEPVLNNILQNIPQIPPLIVRAISIIVIIVVAFALTTILRSSLRKLTEGKVRKHFRRTVFRIFQLIIWIIALFIILGVLGVNLTGLLAGAGFMGIVVGLAAQETLGNVVSGLIMMFSRPFEIGDWIEISDYSGIVEEISIIYTVVRTFDGELVSFPNQMVSSNEVDNKSRTGRLRVRETIGIDYEADPSKAKEIAEEELKKHELTMENPAPRAVVDELADSSVNIILLFWIDDPAPYKRREARSDIITSLKKRYEEEGIGIPFPHRELIQHEKRGWKFDKEG